MKVPLLDLKLQYAKIKEEVCKVTDEIFESQYFILGPNVERLEKQVAEYCGAEYAVGVSSGSDALIIALMVAGIGADDLVLTTPYTFFATVGAITRVGAKPVFADIEPDTFNINPAKAEEAITDRTKAMIPVHLFGRCVSMEPFLELAKTRKFFLIEDAAQAIGATASQGKAGVIGDAGCFSFFPTKNLGAFGDAGMVVTQDKELGLRLQQMRVHGSSEK